MGNENLEKLLKEPQESLKGKVKYVGFCTVFNKKKNKPLMTFDILEGFTEEHGKAVALIKGAMGNLPKETFKVLREVINQTGGLDDDTRILVAEFDKRFRVLVTKN